MLKDGNVQSSYVVYVTICVHMTYFLKNYSPTYKFYGELVQNNKIIFHLYTSNKLSTNEIILANALFVMGGLLVPPPPNKKKKDYNTNKNEEEHERQLEFFGVLDGLFHCANWCNEIT